MAHVLQVQAKSEFQQARFTIDWTIEKLSCITKYPIDVKMPPVSCADLGLLPVTGEWCLVFSSASKCNHDLAMFRLSCSDLSTSMLVECKISTVSGHSHERIRTTHEQHVPGSYIGNDILTIQHVDLFDPTKALLTNDALIVHADIHVTSLVADTTHSKLPRHRDTMSSDYIALRGQFGADTADFAFTSNDGKVFPVHRAILAARCPAFAAMLHHDTVERKTGRCDLTDIDGVTLDGLLDFIYSGGTASLSVTTAERLLVAAEKYSLLVLKDRCKQCLLGHITESNWNRLLELADQHGAVHLKTVVQRYQRRANPVHCNTQ